MPSGDASNVKEKEGAEHEPVYPGTISAGSGSISSTKIKKELEGKKKKKFKKIEYLNKTKVVTAGVTSASLKMGTQTPSYTGDFRIIFLRLMNLFRRCQEKYVQPVPTQVQV